MFISLLQVLISYFYFQTKQNSSEPQLPVQIWSNHFLNKILILNIKRCISWEAGNTKGISAITLQATDENGGGRPV